MVFDTHDQQRIRRAFDAVVGDIGPAPDLDMLTDKAGIVRAQPDPTTVRRPAVLVLASIGAVLLAIGTVMFLTSGDRVESGPFGSMPGTTTPTIDPAWLTVEAGDLTAIAQQQGPGPDDPTWRTPLRTETIWCWYANGFGAEGLVSDFPLEEDLTLAAIEAECATGTDPARLLETPPDTFTLCRGVFTDYQEYATGNDVLAGEIDGPHPGFPVMLGWDSDCVSEQLNTSPDIRLDSAVSLDAVNRARTLEIAVRGAAYTNCLAYTQAAALADAVRQQLGSDWLYVQIRGLGLDTLANEGACFQPFIDQQWGATFIADRDLTAPGDPLPTDGASTTFPPG